PLALVIIALLAVIVRAQDLVTFPQRTLPGEVAIDVNGDGLLDSVGSSYKPKSLELRLGHGNGTFGHAVGIAAPLASGFVLFGAGTGDGVADAVEVQADTVPNQMDFAVFAGGGGSLAPGVPSTISLPFAIFPPTPQLLADMDGDGRAD